MGQHPPTTWKLDSPNQNAGSKKQPMFQSKVLFGQHLDTYILANDPEKPHSSA